MFNRTATILLITSNLWYFGEGLFAPFLALFTRRIGGDILEISAASATYLIASGTLIFLIGRVADRINKRRLLFVGYLLNAVFTFGYLFVSSPLQLLIVQVGLGISFGLATPTWDALYQQNVPVTAVGRAWGTAVGTSQIVTGCAILIGGAILNSFSFTALFVFMGCVQLAAACLQVKLLQESGNE